LLSCWPGPQETYKNGSGWWVGEDTDFKRGKSIDHSKWWILYLAETVQYRQYGYSNGPHLSCLCIFIADQ